MNASSARFRSNGFSLLKIATNRDARFVLAPFDEFNDSLARDGRLDVAAESAEESRDEVLTDLVSAGLSEVRLEFPEKEIRPAIKPPIPTRTSAARAVIGVIFINKVLRGN